MAESIQVNTSLDAETAGQLERMAQDMGYDNRSAFVRWLIRQEWARRNMLVINSPQANPQTIREEQS